MGIQVLNSAPLQRRQTGNDYRGGLLSAVKSAGFPYISFLKVLAYRLGSGLPLSGVLGSRMFAPMSHNRS